ncbi:hypothetical protein JCM6882_009550 [Rhodosporidiobolus microsporus]
MFGEDASESPLLASPWLSRSSGGTPSPLTLLTPDSTPSTPKDASTEQRARRRSSLEDLELLEGLGEDFDSLSVSKGKLRSPPWTEEITLADGMEDLGELAPEVDHEGHIEYKFKLATPTSLHRLEKLRTQLAWRLREGGGIAVYELGLLDDGKIVGLPQEDMQESLQTLGRMLSGLGGGRVEIARVVRIGGSTETSPAPSSPSRSVFPSFDVSPSTSDLDFYRTSRTVPSVDAVDDSTLDGSTSPSKAALEPSVTLPEPVAFFPPEKPRGPTPYPSSRTPEEQAIFRRDKRDQRRIRRAEATAAAEAGVSLSPTSSPFLSPTPSSTSSSTVSPVSSACPTPPIAIRPPRTGSSTSPRPFRGPKPPRSPRRTTTKQQRQEAAAAKRAACGIPSSHAPVERPQNGEVRWVVEAVVHKAAAVGGGAVADGKRRRKSSASCSAEGRSAPSPPEGLFGGDLSEEALTSATEGDEDEDDSPSDDGQAEGWDYLEFDLASLSSSVKNAAAAAREAGMARAATAAVGA